MSAIHREWLDSQAQAQAAQHAQHAQHLDTSLLPAGACRYVPSLVEDVNPTERRWPRTADEAFRTLAWRSPLAGPFHRPGPVRAALELAAATLLGLILVGVFL